MEQQNTTTQALQNILLPDKIYVPILLLTLLPFSLGHFPPHSALAHVSKSRPGSVFSHSPAAPRLGSATVPLMEPSVEVMVGQAVRTG